MNTSNFPSLLQRFFTDRLQGQLGASRHTVASYRDTFRLLLRYAGAQLGREPSELCMEELNVCFLGEFLDHLDSERHNCTRTRRKLLPMPPLPALCLEDIVLQILCSLFSRVFDYADRPKNKNQGPTGHHTKLNYQRGIIRQLALYL